MSCSRLHRLDPKSEFTPQEDPREIKTMLCTTLSHIISKRNLEFKTEQLTLARRPLTKTQTAKRQLIYPMGTSREKFTEFSETSLRFQRTPTDLLESRSL